ncbi:MAG: adenylosuccinate synthase [Spirochaetia bacterium]
MPVTVLCGMQWGDEGKGKLVDLLSHDLDYVVRYQGGNNAGHTIVINNKKYIFHLLPSGVCHPHAQCLLAAGMLIDPGVLLEEIARLEDGGMSSSHIFISDRAHMIMPYHIVLDRLREERLGDAKIGTTCRGIGPAYVDKYERSGLRVADLKDIKTLKEKVFFNVEEKNQVIEKIYAGQALDPQQIYDTYVGYAKKLQHRIVDTTYILQDAVKAEKNILCEGAQALMLDIDHGSYPFVTSSSPTTASACVGTGMGMGSIKNRIGVFKAYCTRVGSGPFPTELDDSVGEDIRRIGAEFGSTTGRSRRTGWLDLPALKYAAMINDFTELAMMKLDVLSGFQRIKIATGYTIDGKETDRVLANVDDYARAIPVYTQLEGWQEDIAQVKSFDALPQAAKAYVLFVEAQIGVGIRTVSVGPDRSQTIRRF